MQLVGQRKAVLPAIERRNGLFWYPSLYEGFEYSANVIYTGASPIRTAFRSPNISSVTMGVGCSGWLGLLYPRESNRIMRDLVESYGGKIVDEVYVPMAASEQRLREIVVRAKELAPDVVFSTIVGRSAQMFYRLYREAGLDPASMTIASLTMAEGEVQVIGAELCEGHITAATHFGSLEAPAIAGLRKIFIAPLATTSRSACGAPAPMPKYESVRAGAGAGRNARHPAAGRGGARPFVRGARRHHPDRSREQPCLVDAADWRVRRDGRFDVVWEAKAAVKPDPYLAVSPLGGRWIGEEISVA